MKKLLALAGLTIGLVIGMSTMVHAEEYVDVKVNSNLLNCDARPRIENNRTILPVRFIAEALNDKVDWNPDTREVTISNDYGKKIKLTLDSNKAIVDGKEVILDQPAVEREDRTFVPIRFVAENMWATVDWFEREQLVSVMSFRADGYPVNMANRLSQSGEYNVSTDYYGNMVLSAEGINATITGWSPNTTGKGLNAYNVDMDIMMSNIDEQTRIWVKNALRVALPNDYETAYMYLICTIRREAYEGFQEDYINPQVQGYLAGRNIKTKALANHYDQAGLSLTYQRPDIGINGNMWKTWITPPGLSNSSVAYFVNLYNITEYTQKDYDTLKKPLFQAELEKYYVYIKSMDQWQQRSYN